MLVNFCDKCLRTDVICSTICTEGYEVSNLVNNSNTGFLAYSCIKPPVTLDFVFISNIQINHIIIWPQVGAQKSCGFKLSVKSSDSSRQPFTEISTAFLKKEELGLLFCQRDISRDLEISAPKHFVKHYIKLTNITNYTSTVRLSILKTENSVPALGKIEIWGKVSSKCGKDIAMNVMSLWMNRFHLSIINNSDTSEETNKNKEENREQICNSLNVPEDFLDPITFEIMTQPIILPSGKIIDQKTLEKHGYNEAIWGRSVSDPFTGISFSNARKPIAALPLKARIDKFLLEYSNEAEVKKLPRVLGTNVVQCNKNVDAITCVPDNPVSSIHAVKGNNQLKRVLSNEDSSKSKYSFKKSFHGHSLPVVSLQNFISSSSSTGKVLNSTIVIKALNKKEVYKKNVNLEEKLISNIQDTSMPSCRCTDKIFYKLPCQHIICRKALLSLEKIKCTNCKLEFKTSDPQRFHLNN